MLTGKVQALNTGKVQVIAGSGKKEVASGIIKTPVEGPVFLTKTKLKGDEQEDLVNHGGVDKAVCVYSSEHYPYWDEKLGIKMEVGAFGENVTVTGLLEKDICIGDTFKWGEAVVQVSQPRHPCYKLAKRHDVKELPLYVQETGYSGFYFRVLQEGQVSKEDDLRFRERLTNTTIAQVNRLNFQEADDVKGLRALAELPYLAESWRAGVENKLRKLVE
ncbi:MOSC domain-containing protein [Alteribacter aurantiacus]|uniref:MOSC domain-containing protein n=1 Tax=Alteribacter aurantiacus TaxID=254410 RepID=UPI0003FE374B|nr:MOSC domain-containing protein [Alteribacter aurantiacus]